MPIEDLEETFGDALREDSNREFTHGEYHPSTVTGCPLKGFLNKMTEDETPLNNYLFQGSAVHYYVQERSELLTKALSESGFHPLDVQYEVSNVTNIGDGIDLVGTCDVLAQGDDGLNILDIKYSSVRPSTHKGRLYKYMSQVNTYSYMFNADRYGLLLIYSRANDRASGNKPKTIPDSIAVIPGTPDRENWDLVKSKASSIHTALEEFGYTNGVRWEKSELETKMDEFWKEIMEIIDKSSCPSYDKECNYCDYKDCCPVNNGKLGGLRGMVKD